MTETRSVAVANIHAIHPHAVLRPEPDKQTDPLRSLSDTVRAREDGIQQVLEAISALNEISVIIAGDLNATMRNTVYERIRSAGFIDSWLVNHSFINGGTWPSVAPLDLALPSALLRIDFVFHSRGLRTTQSEVLSSSLSSDHAGLLVVLSPI
jgi:endonuclease/exonuclease/phosphatase (EEP) superfamily protein YafD